jgi:competence protein ComEA
VFKKLQKFKIIDGILGMGILLIIVGLGMNFIEQQKDKETNVELVKADTKNETAVTQVNKELMIDIEGEVINPGVYKMNLGDRINDILIKSGGLNANADRDWVEKNLNKSEILKDGEKIFIPKVGEILGTLQVSNTSLKSKEINGIVNINSASVEELDKLSGVGPGIAAKIIDYREKNGGFKNINEIKLVSGIGEKLFEKIKNEIGI